MYLRSQKLSMPNHNPLSKQAQDAIAKALSTARLEPYLQEAYGQIDIAIKIYELNLGLCAALYPSLNVFEITFRNKIDTVLQNKYGENWYKCEKFDLKDYESELIKKAEKSLQKNKKKLSRDNILAELTLGFWSAFILKKDYKTTVFDQCIKQIFLFAKPQERSFKDISKDFKPNLLYLRNRVFHHEPIWSTNYKVQDKYKYLCRVLGWMSPEVLSWLQTYDNFPEVYRSVSDELNQLALAKRSSSISPILKNKNDGI